MRQRGGESAIAGPWLDALDPIRRGSPPAPHAPTRGEFSPSPPGGSAASRSRIRLGGEEDSLLGDLEG
eukprot:12124587-Alexandrium_andersonii.AAC.1